MPSGLQEKGFAQTCCRSCELLSPMQPGVLWTCKHHDDMVPVLKLDSVFLQTLRHIEAFRYHAPSARQLSS